MDYVLKMYPAVKVNDMGCTYIANGRRIDNRSLIDGFIEDLSSGTTVRLYHKDSFVALGIIQNNYIKPTKVFYGE
jgi:tRNA U55 pseudouridine synthase TruB